ncbi:epoxide hydrolase domain-containing protein [Cadophora sp. MPI-SDFR-AT-0126]|nr:epoxide hydrolase domain-containing protein [Leotiomycetes sp. MPI-SDFR-AT-0126]
MTEPTPFKISVSDDLLSFITQRVSTARLPPGINLSASEEWSHGVPTPIMSQLQQYWVKKYDWRAVEARINSHLKMFTLPINHEGEDLTIHFVHHRSSREGAIPLLFQHGWPGNFLEVEKIIDELVEPKEEGRQAYHVVAPSLPGFVFSDMSKRADFGLSDIAHIDHKLMTALGYETYMGQGGDWGSFVVRIMGILYPEHCVAVHINMVISGPPSWKSPLTLIRFIAWAIWQDKSKDGSLLGRMMWWQKDEQGYLEIQGTKAQTLAYALVDSPMGMLAWIRDKVEHLVDDDFTWEEEEIITWAMLYLIPGTAGHSSIYKNAKEPLLTAQKPYMTALLPKSVDFGASIFPKDVLNIPHFWASSTVSPNIIFWRTHDKGGHFPSIEKPTELISDIRDFTAVVDLDRRVRLFRAGRGVEM